MKGQKSALAFSTLAMMFCFAVWGVFAPIANEIEQLYGLTALQTSILIATPVLLGSVMRLPMGILTDRYGGKKVYTLTMLFVIIPLIGAGFANSYGTLLFWAFLIGMAGTSFAIAIAYVSRWYPPEKQGFALGIAGMGNIGTAVATFSIPTIVALFGLSWAFWGLAMVMILMAILFWTRTEELPKPEKTKTVGETLSVLKMKDTWILSLLYFLTFGGFVAFSMYLPTLMMDLFSLSAIDAGMRTGGFIVLATIMRPIGGTLADKIGGGRILTIVFAGVLAGALVLSMATYNMILFTAGCLVIAFLVGAGNGAVFKIVPEVAPGNTGAVTGVVGAAGGLGGFFPPLLMGTVRDMTGEYTIGFILLAIFTLYCLVMNKKRYDTKGGIPNETPA